MEIVRVALLGDAETTYSLNNVKGKVVRIFVDIGDLDNATDVVVTGEDSGVAIYTGTNLTADTIAAPTTATGVEVFQERIKCVVAQGVAGKKGQISFAVTDS